MSERVPGMSGRQPQAIRTALAVLRSVAQAGPGVTARQISAELDLPPATTYRILNLLVGDEYLVRLPDLRGFALGARVGELVGAPRVPTTGVNVETVIERVREATGLPVSMAAYDDDVARIAIADPRRPLPVDDLALTNLHASALGRLLLATRPQWRALLPKPSLNRLTPKTIVDPTDLDAALRAVRRDGHAVQIEEVRRGLGCIAVPVHDGAGQLAAGLTISADAEVIDKQRTDLVAQLCGAAVRLRPLLAQEPPQTRIGRSQ